MHKIVAMARPVTLFTGQWADLPLEDLAEKAGRWGFDGLELACWGDHFEVDRALAESDYCGGMIDLCRESMLSHTAWPTRWLLIANTWRPCFARRSRRPCA